MLFTFFLVLLSCLLQQSLIRTIFHFRSFSIHLTILQISIHIISHCIQGRSVILVPLTWNWFYSLLSDSHSLKEHMEITLANVRSSTQPQPQQHGMLYHIHIEIVQGCIKTHPTPNKWPLRHVYYNLVIFLSG